MSPAEMAQAHAAFPMLDDLAAELRPLWANLPIIDLPDLRFRLIIGDARQTLPAWDGKADAWFLDGFSPAKNPELWEEDLMQAVADHTQSTGTAATYSAAGHVRRRLEAAGFQVERASGFGRKRHMTRAWKAT